MIRWLIIAICALLLALGVVALDRSHIKAELKHTQDVLEQERQKAREDAAAASATYRERESQWAASQKESQHVAQIAQGRANDDRRSADAARERLLIAARAAASRPGPTEGSQAQPGSQATGGPADLFAELLGRIDARAGELAVYADAARIAGEACEREHDALTR